MFNYNEYVLETTKSVHLQGVCNQNNSEFYSSTTVVRLLSTSFFVLILGEGKRRKK